MEHLRSWLVIIVVILLLAVSFVRGRFWDRQRNIPPKFREEVTAFLLGASLGCGFLAVVCNHGVMSLLRSGSSALLTLLVIVLLLVFAIFALMMGILGVVSVIIKDPREIPMMLLEQ